MKICFTGDLIMLSPPTDDYWTHSRVIEFLKSCDVRCGNLEMGLSGDTTFASTFCGGQWVTTSPDRLNLIKKFGYDYLNTANNHTMDFSYLGMQYTNKLLDEHGLLHTGSGDSLEEASEPAYLTRDGLKIAFISCTASCDDAARAGDPVHNIPPRPGVSMLRHSEDLYVTPEYLALIDQIAEMTCINARFLKAVRMGIHSLSPDIHRLGRLQFKEGTRCYKHSHCNKRDLKRIKDSIELAKRKGADLVFVSVHSHDIKGMTDDTADYYLEEFAHECIDSGASAIIGTGTHQLKGIELYKGRPIFYSLGNFLFASELIEYAPADYYERYGIDSNITPEEFYNIRSKNGTIGLERDPYNYRSIIPVLSYDADGELTDLSLRPIELGFSSGNCDRGFPLLAEEDVCDEIYSRLKTLSDEYGTGIEMNRDVIRIPV